MLGKHFWWSHTNVDRRVHGVRGRSGRCRPDDRSGSISAIDWPQFNHNGHWIGFGPDGMLYISTGDGGYANDWGIGHNVTEGNGQDLLSISTARSCGSTSTSRERRRTTAFPHDNPFVGQEATALPEIWAYGLRNPWRCSFDMGGENELFCGDVQQNSYEEVSIIEKGGNHGWRAHGGDPLLQLRGSEQPSRRTAAPTGMVMPIIEYDNCTARAKAAGQRLRGHLGDRRLRLPRQQRRLGRQVHLRRLEQVVRRAGRPAVLRDQGCRTAPGRRRT